MKNPFAKPHWGWIAVVLLQVLQAATLLPWIVAAGFVVMAFDAPGSEKQWQPWTLALTVWSYPFWLGLAGCGSWFLLAHGKRAAAVLIALLFTLPAPLFLFLLAG